MIPSGAPRAASHGGKRVSNGIINIFPTGERPRVTSPMRLTTTSQRPVRARRVGSKKSPRIPIKIVMLEGNVKTPRSLEDKKNMSEGEELTASDPLGVPRSTDPVG